MKYGIALFLALFALTAGSASARQELARDHGGVYIGDTVVVAPDQIVEGDVTVIGGNAMVEGQVDGDVTTYGGTIQMGPNASISGSKHQFAGELASALPWAQDTSTIVEQSAKMTTLLAYSVIVLLIFLIFPIRVRTAMDRIEKHPGLSAAVGVLAIVSLLPIALLLFVSVIGWPLIPLEIVAYIAGVLIGQAALSLLIGRRLLELVHVHTTPSPLGALVLGLIVVAAAELLPHVGWLVVGLVWLIGLGSAVLAFIRETPLLTPGTSVSPPPSGPPMPA